MKKLIISEIISIGIVLALTLLTCLLMNYYKPTRGIALFQREQAKEQTEFAAAMTIIVALVVIFTTVRPTITVRHATSPGNYLVAKSKADCETIGLVAMGTAAVAFVALSIVAESVKEAIFFVVVLVVIFPSTIIRGEILGIAIAVFVFALMFITAYATHIPTEWTGKSFWPVSVHPKDEKPIFEPWGSPKGFVTGLIAWLTNFGILYGLPRLLI